MAEAFYVSVRNASGSSFTIPNLTETTKVGELVQKVYGTMQDKREASMLLVHRGSVINDPAKPADL